jgi:hypothetical protein
MKRRNLVLLLAATIISTAISPTTAQAANKTSAPSAILAGLQAQKSEKMVVDNRAKILTDYLQSYNSPLAPHAATFVQQADKHDLDWKLVPAITGVESYYGQMIPPYSYNGWGFGVYGNNVRRFASWDEGITVVTQALRTEYMDSRGAQNVYQIGSTYAADPNWANKVTHFINDIEAFENQYTNTTVSISL